MLGCAVGRRLGRTLHPLYRPSLVCDLRNGRRVSRRRRALQVLLGNCDWADAGPRPLPRCGGAPVRSVGRQAGTRRGRDRDRRRALETRRARRDDRGADGRRAGTRRTARKRRHAGRSRSRRRTPIVGKSSVGDNRHDRRPVRGVDLGADGIPHTVPGPARRPRRSLRPSLVVSCARCSSPTFAGSRSSPTSNSRCSRSMCSHRSRRCSITTERSWSTATRGATRSTPSSATRYPPRPARSICKTPSNDWTRSRSGCLPELALRLGGHVGPIFPVIDPILNRQSFVGAHVNRTARIEPVTPPGAVYVTSPFAAALELAGGHSFACDYVGQRPAAKDFGVLRMYRLRRTNNASDG